MHELPFWKQKKLHQLNDSEWESLCDGCGRCCLHKLEDIDSNELCFTNIACKLLDLNDCRCTQYEDRFKWIPDCISLRQDLNQTIHWLPGTCAYRFIFEGKDLPAWHPLVSGNKDSVENAGISIKHFAQSENAVNDNYQNHIIDDC
ncbi:MAG: YcgN family cysteine cluster protein [Gammaproteobacteria bacterium]|nr:YcgN family cysteine cluster protein [Gammaproteobacteria bacterium]